MGGGDSHHGLRGLRVGEASNPGPNPLSMFRRVGLGMRVLSASRGLGEVEILVSSDDDTFTTKQADLSESGDTGKSASAVIFAHVGGHGSREEIGVDPSDPRKNATFCSKLWRGVKRHKGSMSHQGTCRWVWRRKSRPSHEGLIMAGSQCWQKMTQTMEKRQPHFRNQGRRHGWMVLVGGTSGREVLSPHPERDLFHADSDAGSAVSDGGPSPVRARQR